jgi:hypothetical protein
VTTKENSTKSLKSMGILMPSSSEAILAPKGIAVGSIRDSGTQMSELTGRDPCLA